MTQSQLADRISLMSGKPITASAVCKWENGKCEIGISSIQYICKALGCSSYTLYPISQVYDEMDVRILDAVKNLPLRTKLILDYMIHDWDGNGNALWEFGLLYTKLAKSDRKNIAWAGIAEYKEILKNDPNSIDPANGIDLDMQMLIRETRMLEKGDDD